MASPQKENGYTTISNEILEAFAHMNLSCYEWRVVFCIIRYSYGWHKKTAKLQCKKIAETTGIDVRLIPRTINRLLAKKVITRVGDSFGLQKDHETWISIIPRDDKAVDKSVDNYVDKSVDKSVDNLLISPNKTGRASSLEMINIISGDDKTSSLEMMQMPHSPNNNNNLQPPKDIPKESFKDNSYASNANSDKVTERNRILKKLKRYFPKLTVPNSIPTQKMDYVIWMIEKGDIHPEKIRSPLAYMKGIKKDKGLVAFRSCRNEERQREHKEMAKPMTEENRQENIERVRELIQTIIRREHEDKKVYAKAILLHGTR